MNKKEKIKKKESMETLEYIKLDENKLSGAKCNVPKGSKYQYDCLPDSHMMVFSETPEKAAESLLVELSDILHLPVEAIDLRIIDKKQTAAGFLVKFQQYKEGLPVEGAEITVQSDKNGVIRSISAQCLQGF